MHDTSGHHMDLSQELHETRATLFLSDMILIFLLQHKLRDDQKIFLLQLYLFFCKLPHRTIFWLSDPKVRLCPLRDCSFSNDCCDGRTAGAQTSKSLSLDPFGKVDF